MSPTDALVAELDQEFASTRSVLQAVPADRLSYRPHDKSFPLGDLCLHVANTVGWGATTLQTEELDTATFVMPQSPKTPDDFLSLFEENTKVFREALSTSSPEALMVPWTLRTGDQAHFTLPRAAVLRTFVLNHLYHHRGQLTVYLRLIDVPVPGVYGPSADDAA